MSAPVILGVLAYVLVAIGVLRVWVGMVRADRTAAPAGGRWAMAAIAFAWPPVLALAIVVLVLIAVGGDWDA